MILVFDTSLHNLFLQHVDTKRLPLPEVIMIDEVYTNFKDDCKYSLVIMNFFTHNIIDLLSSRRDSYTSSYFLSIPLKERNNVKFIISDMYEPYLNYMNHYFLNSQTAIDSFHVISWLIDRIAFYLRQLRRKYDDDELWICRPHIDKSIALYYSLDNILWNENDLYRLLQNKSDAILIAQAITYLKDYLDLFELE